MSIQNVLLADGTESLGHRLNLDLISEYVLTLPHGDSKSEEHALCVGACHCCQFDRVDSAFPTLSSNSALAVPTVADPIAVNAISQRRCISATLAQLLASKPYHLVSKMWC